MALLVTVPLLLAALSRGRSGGLPDWFSPEPFEVRLNGSVYAIPGNYLVHVSRDIEGKMENAVLRTLWPGLEPLRPDNVHLWERRLPERHIHIVLTSGPRDGYSQLQGFLRLRNARAEPADFELTRYRSRLEEYYVGEESEDRAPDGSPLVLLPV